VWNYLGFCVNLNKKFILSHMRKVIIIGSSGFIGSAVANHFAKSGVDVAGVDYVPPAGSPVFQFHQVERGRELNPILAIRDLSEYAILHFAGMGDIQQCNEDPAAAIRANILDFNELLSACHQRNLRGFFYTSSIYVNNDHAGFYSVTKRAAEDLLRHYRRLGLKSHVLRLGTVYGTNAGKTNSIRRIVDQAVTEGKIEYWGNGEEVREFIHVHDVARSVFEIYEESPSLSTINLSGIHAYSIKQVIGIVNEMFQNKLVIRFKNEENRLHYKMTPYVLDDSMAMKWTLKAFVELQEGLFQICKEKIDGAQKV
jgi:UDP-glucose 4-epimerase